MKLIQEYLIKIIILIFIFVIIIETLLIFLLLNRASKIFSTTYNETIAKTEQKTIEITEKIQKYTSNLLMRYYTDLKLIGKHSYLMIEKISYWPNNFKYLNLNINNEQKDILFATLEELLRNNYTKNVYNYTTQTFEYSEKYEKEFTNTFNNNFLLKSLFSENHQELNTISYYSSSKNLSVLDSNVQIFTKYMINILKSIYIRRYLVKRKNMDYAHFIILYNDELYIYPPQPYNVISLYNFNNTYPFSNCYYDSDKNEQKFPLCAYNYIRSKIINPTDNYIAFINEKFHYEKIYAAICLKIFYVNVYNYSTILCVEINLSKFFDDAITNQPEKLEYGMIAFQSQQIFPVFYNRKDLYEDIKATFNDTVSEKYRISENRRFAFFSLFHFFYYNLTKIAKEHPELNVNFTEIEEEFEGIYKKMASELEESIRTENTEKITFYFTKSICRKGLLVNTYECLKDEFEMIILPLVFQNYKLDLNFIEEKEYIDKAYNISIFSIIATNPTINSDKVYTILHIKLERTIVLYFFLSLIILGFFILFVNMISEYGLNSTNKIIKELNKIDINNNSKKFDFLKEDKIYAPNNEIMELKTIYEAMKKALIIKQVFGKENFLNKQNCSDFYNLVQNIKRKNIKEICNSYLAFHHFKTESYNLAEAEFLSTVSFVKENENKLISGKNSEYEDKIKDSIKRSSSASYLNEYSKFEGVDEIMLHIIDMKILKQRFIYLYAMTKFKLGNEINNNTNMNTSNYPTLAANKKKSKKDKDKKMNYFKDAIKLFNECKNINILLGINQIKVIYSLIMISKCYIQLNDYKNAIININEALSLFFEFSKSFKEYHSKNYNPKIMLFIENTIFHYILFTIVRICYSFNRPFACNWIIIKIFESSPFLIGNVHYHSGIFIQYYLDRNKLKLNKLDAKLYKNTIVLKEYEKAKRYYSKIVSRMNIKKQNNKIIISEKMIGDSVYSTSYRNMTESKTDKSIFSSTFKREMATSKVSSSLHFKSKNLTKIVTLCLSEKVLNKVNGSELKDVIIKYFQKYFMMDGNDKFSFIQFAYNGKKTVHFKLEQLGYFLLKIQKTKNTFELADDFETNSNIPFMELFNIFDSIVKSYPPNEETDNIIIMFINSDDIRFTSINECLNIVDELNKNNTSVFLLSYDIEIKPEKINNIHSFLNGLFEGYFLQIKNYQQIKQLFINIATKKSQSNFFGYDFDSLDHEL